MTPARRARVLADNGNVCAHEGCEITDRLEIDHIVALELGGADDFPNLVPLCRDHHKEKTRHDVWMIAKARRIRAREDGTRRERKAILSPGFSKALTRGFDGIVRRKEPA